MITGAWTSAPLLGEQASFAARFHGNFEYASKFKGPPSNEVDEAWDSIIPGNIALIQTILCRTVNIAYLCTAGVMSIPSNVYEQLNASKHAVKVPPQVGGGYMAIFEGFHLIHCVVSIPSAADALHLLQHAYVSAEGLMGDNLS